MTRVADHSCFAGEVSIAGVHKLVLPFIWRSWHCSCAEIGVVAFAGGVGLSDV